MMTDLKTSIINEVARLCAIETNLIQANKLLLEYGMDSVRTLEMCCFLEDEYDIEIEDDEAAEAQTVDDIIQLVEKKIG